MAKRTVAISALLLLLVLLPVSALAASTTQAKGPISLEEECTLTLSYGYEGVAFANAAIKLYKIADVSSDYQYTLTAAFASSGLMLNGIQTQGEWNTIRTTLEGFILAGGVQPLREAVTDATGQVRFSKLVPGLYLASGVTVAQEAATCHFDAALVALPGLDGQGYWQKDVAVLAKPELLPPAESEEEVVCKVIKLWQGDGAARPQSVEVEIFRNGQHYETVTLSSQNQWSYQWKVKNDGASWNVTERNVPAGYTATVQVKGADFVITNTWNKPSDPQTPSQTGDTFPVMLFVVLFYLSGIMLLILGIAGKRKGHETTN